MALELTMTGAGPPPPPPQPAASRLAATVPKKRTALNRDITLPAFLRCDLVGFDACPGCPAHRVPRIHGVIVPFSNNESSRLELDTSNLDHRCRGRSGCGRARGRRHKFWLPIRI